MLYNITIFNYGTIILLYYIIAYTLVLHYNSTVLDFSTISIALLHYATTVAIDGAHVFAFRAPPSGRP